MHQNLKKKHLDVRRLFKNVSTNIVFKVVEMLHIEATLPPCKHYMDGHFHADKFSFSFRMM